MERVLKDLLTLFCPVVPKGSFLGDPIDQLLEQLAVCFPKIQGPDFSFCLTLRTTNSSCLKTVRSRIYYWLWITESAIGYGVTKRIRNPDLGIDFTVPVAAAVLCPSCFSVIKCSECLFPVCVHLTGNEGVSSKPGLLCILFQTLSKPKVHYATL